MTTPIRLLIASALTALAATSAQADFAYSTQGVTFTYHGIDADSFSLRIQGALDATGSWAPATHLAYLGFKNLGDLSGVTGASVTINPTPASAINWSLTAGELSGQGCNSNSNSNAICLDANPDVKLSNDLLFTVDLIGSGINLGNATSPIMKVTLLEEYTRQGQTAYRTAGGVVEQTLQNTTADNRLPEPASLALAGIAFLGVAATRRRVRG